MRTFRLLTAVALAAAGLIVLLFLPRLAARAATGAVCTWSAPADGIPRNWSDAANWSCGAAPGAGDTAIVNHGGNVINVDVPITAQNLTMTDGELRGYQTLTITGQMTWTYGTIFGGAALSPTGALETLVIAPGASLNLDSSYVRLKHGRLVNYGTVQQGNTGVVWAENAVFDNRAGGVFAVADGRILDDNWPPGSKAGLFINAGTLLKQNGGEYSMRARLTNAGHVQVVSGTLRLYHGEPPDLLVTHTGSFAVAPAGTLIFDGLKSDFASSSSFAVSGTLRFENGAAGTVRGAFDAPGLTSVNAAALHFERPDGAATLTHLNLGGNSRLRGTNDITVTGVMTMSGWGAVVEGSSSNTNTLNIAPGATLRLEQSGGLSFRTLNNHGSFVQATGQSFFMVNDAIFNNGPTGVYTVSSGGLGWGMPWSDIGKQFNNQGRMVKEGIGEFKVWFSIAVSNSGTLEVVGGTLRVDGDFVQSAGETRLRNGSVLGHGPGWSGDLIFNGGALRGLGALDFGTNPGVVQNNGAVVDPIGRLTINNGGYHQAVSGTLQIDVGGLTPDTEHDVLSVSGSATLDGRLILAATDGFAPAAGDVFNIMTYGSHNGEFAVLDQGLGLAFEPEYQSGGVVISDNPTLIEFSQKPDRRISLSGENNGYTLRAFNPTTRTITVTLTSVLPGDFRYLTGTATGDLGPGEPGAALNGNVQTLAWPPVAIAPSAAVTLHFGVAMTTTPGVYTHAATLDLAPAAGSARQIRSRDQLSIDRPAIADTEVSPSRGGAYPPATPGGTWQLVFGRSTPLDQVSVVITTTPVCALATCGPLAYVAVVHDNQVFTMTRLGVGSNRFRGEIPAGHYARYEPVFIVPVWVTPTLVSATGLPDAPLDDDGDQCDILNGGAFLTGGQSWCPRHPDIDPARLVDPSGYVTDARTGAPIQGATVTLYRVPSALPDTRSTTRQCRTVDTRPGSAWDLLPPATANQGLFEEPGYSPATIDPSINPLRTDEAGHYGWDVIRGCWYVKVAAPGYFTRYSAVVGVPPEVTDLDIALTPWPRVHLPLVVR